jgi:hypothetical protein
VKDHTAQIIQLFGPRPKPGKTFPVRVIVSAERPAAAYSRHDPATITAENFRLRKERYDAWRQADAVMNYWRAAMQMGVAIFCMQNFGAVVDDRHPFVTPEDRGTLVAKWRLAWAKLMLTPAANSKHVRWKRMQLIAKNYEYTGLPPARIERRSLTMLNGWKRIPHARAGANPRIRVKSDERAHPQARARRPVRRRRL